ncbi:hypothetical protein M501DRAFT_860399 [Patellaria atrata CBS 101060]|uniref:Uncharacterized protein n=1 Tax=Patellaria atrata CBS 101060 TaxID=1346257 RepID=A0A9P4S8T8_9PEZI|nr:hypothetical protein M501DRAFT_860399 [Patellaria atrata CBS 101060]
MMVILTMSTKSKFKQRAKTPDREAQPFSEPSSPKPTFLQKLTSLVSNPRLVPDRSRSEPAVSITNKSVNLAKSSTPRDITHHPTFEPTQIDDHGIYFFPPYTGSPHSSILSALCPPRRARSDSINSNPSYRSVQSTESHTNIRSIEPQSVGLGISVGPSFHEHTHTSPLQQTKTINQSIDTYSSTPHPATLPLHPSPLAPPVHRAPETIPARSSTLLSPPLLLTMKLNSTLSRPFHPPVSLRLPYLLLDRLVLHSQLQPGNHFSSAQETPHNFRQPGLMSALLLQRLIWRRCRAGIRVISLRLRIHLRHPL